MEVWVCVPWTWALHFLLGRWHPARAELPRVPASPRGLGARSAPPRELRLSLPPGRGALPRASLLLPGPCGDAAQQDAPTWVPGVAPAWFAAGLWVGSGAGPAVPACWDTGAQPSLGGPRGRMRRG
uniref:Uncharacterized protein n=1 Tax=Anser brachyrhynchus TaxID=132585 RepID=A0A8B9C3W8_9AVES